MWEYLQAYLGDSLVDMCIFWFDLFYFYFKLNPICSEKALLGIADSCYRQLPTSKDMVLLRAKIIRLNIWKFRTSSSHTVSGWPHLREKWEKFFAHGKSRILKKMAKVFEIHIFKYFQRFWRILKILGYFKRSQRIFNNLKEIQRILQNLGYL